MRDEKFLVRSLFFSSRTSENARTFTSDLENERDKISIIDSKKQKKAKILFKRLPLLFKEHKVSLFRSKFKKTENEFYRTDREKTTKKL